ncbi:MarR family transcriptional regulator [Chitinophaga varians]|uniref:MarR family transcriptional regulator n=1 Tax=Chitinophaga varians TaxID=2202339 RepID=A0A847S168_9BACT|nr:MarR family transcriptional regulator [Chitinophaga varians]NLR66858.1 MarR family transcriptional regulator [Chitinophaga varians]
MDSFATASSLRLSISNLNKRLRKQVYSTEGFSLSELSTLSYVYQQGAMFPSELAELVKVKNQSMSQILNSLETGGLITRTQSPEDKRKMSVTITPKGKKMVEKTRHERDEWLAEAIEQTLSKEEKKLLTTVLPLLNKIADYK